MNSQLILAKTLIIPPNIYGKPTQFSSGSVGPFLLRLCWTSIILRLRWTSHHQIFNSKVSLRFFAAAGPRAGMDVVTLVQAAADDFGTVLFAAFCETCAAACFTGFPIM